jgi:N-[(2S)-2-amino-2-carboxyethyl]-L-glutamate dehydrogenase
MMHLEKKLQEKNTKSIIDVVDNCIDSYPSQHPIMFNPMGMAVFDIAIANYFCLQAKLKGIGEVLD